MTVKKTLGIGMQNIRDFALENRIYVDKTEKIHAFMALGKHNFIVRPRRFGKSLLLDTIAAIYEGSKELFVETWIYDKIDWEAQTRPTLRIDFTLIEYTACSLEQGLQNYFAPIAQSLGIGLENMTSRDLFRLIIAALSKEKEIVVLVDEYEMPVTDFVGKDEAIMNENIDTLKKLYSVLKGAGRSIFRSYITGVSKIGRVGFLSDLNMLNDLTLDKRFTTLLGYTEKELRHYYWDYIEAAAQEHNISTDAMLLLIKEHYNGYSWDGIAENKVYNPFSIVNFFQSLQFRNYWFNTGTPTVLARGARKQQITMNDLEHIEGGGNLLENANLTQFYSLSLLFQAGYLTIKEVLGDDWFLLGFPNQEVRQSFASYLLAEYIGDEWANMEYTIAFKLRTYLEREQLKDAFKIFVPVLQSTSYDITKHTEGYFHTIMHVLLYSTSLTVFSELESNQGRLDTVCIAQKAVYIFEFKIDSNAEKAINQIKMLNYAARFWVENKALYIIGVNFDTKDKKIDDILVEKWGNDIFVRLEGDFTPQ